MIGNTNDVNEWCVGDIKVLYSYQDKVWVFKGVVTETDNKVKNGSTRGDIERGILNKYFK